MATNQWDDARIEREAEKALQRWRDEWDLQSDDGIVMNLTSTIAALVRRVRDEQREADAVKCDEIADYHRAQAEDWWENHVVCAESCAAAIREKG